MLTVKFILWKINTFGINTMPHYLRKIGSSVFYNFRCSIAHVYSIRSSNIFFSMNDICFVGRLFSTSNIPNYIGSKGHHALLYSIYGVPWKLLDSEFEPTQLGDVIVNVSVHTFILTMSMYITQFGLWITFILKLVWTLVDIILILNQPIFALTP
jgi:hypothetical protein